MTKPGKLVYCEEDGTVAEVIREERVKAPTAPQAPTPTELELRNQREAIAGREAFADAAALREQRAIAAWKQRKAKAVGAKATRPPQKPVRAVDGKNIPHERKTPLRRTDGLPVRVEGPLVARFYSAVALKLGERADYVALEESSRTRNWIVYRGLPRVAERLVYRCHEPFLTLLASQVAELREAGRLELRSGGLFLLAPRWNVTRARAAAGASAGIGVDDDDGADGADGADAPGRD